MNFSKHKTSTSGALVLVGSRAVKEEGTGSYSFPDLDPMDQRYVHDNIYGFEKLLESEEGSEEQIEGLRRLLRFRESVPYLVKRLAASYINLVRARTRVDGIAPIESRIHAEYPRGIPKIGLLELVRNGSWATQIFLDEMLKFFGLVDFKIVTVMGQREGETLEEIDTHPEFKGYIDDLDRRDLIIVDPFLATGKSARNAIRGNKERNDGMDPLSLTQLSIHCQNDGLKMLVNEGVPNTTILCVAEHQTLSDKGYLLEPSGGDGGRRGTNTQDKKPERSS